MDDEGLKIIHEALDTQLRNEDFERAVGRTVRRRNLEFKKYVEVVGELRELALAESVTPEDAARKLLSRS